MISGKGLATLVPHCHSCLPTSRNTSRLFFPVDVQGTGKLSMVVWERFLLHLMPRTTKQERALYFEIASGFADDIDVLGFMELRQARARRFFLSESLLIRSGIECLHLCQYGTLCVFYLALLFYPLHAPPIPCARWVPTCSRSCLRPCYHFRILTVLRQHKYRAVCSVSRESYMPPYLQSDSDLCSINNQLTKV